MDWYLFFKSVHFIAWVSWFAGLFYLPRLFVYHVEALQKPEPERSILAAHFTFAQRRLYLVIMMPALVLTFAMGLGMILTAGWAWWKLNIWLHWKLLLVVLLAGYHFYCGRLIKRLAQGEPTFSSTGFRLFNEVSTLFLVAIVLLAVFKNTLSFLYAFVALIALGFLLALGVKAYKRWRN